MYTRKFYRLIAYGSQKYRFVHQASAKSEIGVLAKQDTKVTQIANGINVASLENYSPVAEIALVVKAGSRYENNKENLGITHCLRNAAFLSTKNHSAFALTRNLEVQGSKLWLTGSRDHIIYHLQCSRDEVDSGLHILSEITNNQVFKPWELEDVASNLHYDVEMHKNNPVSVLLELLHKAAFRGGLSNSLFSPSWMVGKHDSEMLHDYVHKYFTSSRISAVGLGVEHDHFETTVNNLFQFKTVHDSNSDTSKFFPDEIREEADIKQVHVGIVVEGSGCNNTKEALSLSALECIFGMGSQNKFSKLSEAVSKTVKDPVYVDSLNINYADTGLFGVYICGSPYEMNKIVPTVVSEMKKLSKSVNKNSLDTAKHQLKAKILYERENFMCRNVLTSMISEVSNYGQIRNTKDIMKAIDDLKVSDVESVASRVMKAKPAMAAYGRLHETPYVDELIQ